MIELARTLNANNRWYVLHVIRKDIHDGQHDRVVRQLHVTDKELTADLLAAHETVNLRVKAIDDDSETAGSLVYEEMLADQLDNLSQKWGYGVSSLEAALLDLIK